MASNPYNVDALKRSAQIQQLAGLPGAAPPAPPPGSPPAAPPPVVGAPPAGRPPVSNTMPVGGGSRGRFEGFNEARAASSGDPNSRKDATYRFLQGIGYNPAGRSMADNEAFLRSQMEAANAAGLNWRDVRGDKVYTDTMERPGVFEWIDLIRNSGGGDDQAFQWLPDSENPNAEQVAMGGGGMGGPMLNPAADNSALAKIMAEIQAAQDGQDSPAAREAIMQILQQV